MYSLGGKTSNFENCAHAECNDLVLICEVCKTNPDLLFHTKECKQTRSKSYSIMPHIHTKPDQHDMTASAYILRQENGVWKCLVHFHKKVEKLMQVGGHIELNETPWQTITHELSRAAIVLLNWRCYSTRRIVCLSHVILRIRYRYL